MIRLLFDRQANAMRRPAALSTNAHAAAPDPERAARTRKTAMRMPYLPVLVASILLSAVGAHAGEGAWEFVLESEGIVVHRRQVEGSNMLEFRGRGIIDAAPSRVIAVVRDADAHHEWMANCVGSREIEKTGPRSHRIYNRTAAPWPVKDRDVVLFGDMKYRGATAVIGFESIELPGEPPVDGAVRMPFLRGHWLLEALDGGRRTKVEYLVHADPGGAIPAWVSNFVSRKLPHKTLLALRDRVKQKTYPAYEQSVEADAGYVRFIQPGRQATSEASAP